ncbi:hypothetical protein CGC21_17700 [Leishmania donovani]|uniref:Uncharacterized protein n=1 Tax=Leishmania donovani TaxID=5661 RepID=A0A504Y5T9_LEIDO|nr:hypothetical protein CGC21_17700 [Leishmania donovani]
MPTLHPHTNAAAVFTDSLPFMKALNIGPVTALDGALRPIWWLILHLAKRKMRLSFQFAFGRAGISQRGRVDELAKTGCLVVKSRLAFVLLRISSPSSFGVITVPLVK